MLQAERIGKRNEAASILEVTVRFIEREVVEVCRFLQVLVENSRRHLCVPKQVETTGGIAIDGTGCKTSCMHCTGTTKWERHAASCKSWRRTAADICVSQNN